MDYIIEATEENIDFRFNKFLDGKEFRIAIQKPADKPNARPVLFYTATSDIRDFIANITEIVGKKCSVNGFYREAVVTLNNVPIKDDKITKVGQRVMVTEHVDVAGKFELIATTHRVLCQSDPGLNFVNVGWTDDSGSVYHRIDVYTGEFIIVSGHPIRS